jgi:hypothetical protein
VVAPPGKDSTWPTNFEAPLGKVQIGFRLTSDDLVSPPQHERARVDDVPLTR